MEHEACRGSTEGAAVSDILHPDAISGNTAGHDMISDLAVPRDKHTAGPRLREYEDAFMGLLAHEREALHEQLKQAIGPDSRQFVRNFLIAAAEGGIESSGIYLLLTAL